MKKLGIAVVVILVLALGLPFVFGSVTESTVTKRIEEMNSGAFWTVELKSYERGWLSSHAAIDVGLNEQYFNQIAAMGGAFGMPGAPRLGVLVDFAHGPVALLDGVYLGWSKMIARPDPATPGLADAQQLLGMPYLFEFRGRSSFFGTMAFDAEIPAINLSRDEGAVQFSGATSEGTFDGVHLTSDTRIDSISIDSPFFAFVLTNLRGNTDNDLLSQYVAPGTGTFSIEKISVTNPLAGSAPLVDASNLRFGSNVTLNDAETALDMEVTYEFDSIVANNMQVAGASLGMAIRNLDRQLLETYVELAQSAAIAGGDPSAIFATLMPAIERGLAAGPSFALDPFRFRLDDEPFEAHLQVTTDPAKLPPAGSLDLQDPSLLMAIVSSDADVTVSKKLAARLAGLAMQGQFPSDPSLSPEQVAQMAEAQAGLILVQLVGQGILTDAGDNYRTEVRLANGALLLNGNPMPFGL
jgi:uncharacterized protein YdgA (DUF945 family)